MTPIRVRPTRRTELDDSVEFLQSGFWAAFKERFGWHAHPFAIDYRDFSRKLLVLSRRLAPGLRLAYVPFGPAWDEPDLGREQLLSGLGESLRPLLPSDTVMIRFDLPWFRAGEGNFPPQLETDGRLRRSPVHVQPPSTVLLDVEREEAEILSGMKSKTRYNIGLASRKGVRVVEGDERLLPDWYALHRETARRDRIAVHSFSYYSTLLDLACSYGDGAPEFRLLLADVEGETVAGIVVAFRRRRAWYAYGASSDRRRNTMPNYALQWHAIRLARERKCLTYDLFGIPAADDPTHAMHGLYRFKIGFGGELINRFGCYDVVLAPVRYGVLRHAETAREFYYKRLRKVR